MAIGQHTAFLGPKSAAKGVQLEIESYRMFFSQLQHPVQSVFEARTAHHSLRQEVAAKASALTHTQNCGQKKRRIRLQRRSATLEDTFG